MPARKTTRKATKKRPSKRAAKKQTSKKAAKKKSKKAAAKKGNPPKAPKKYRIKVRMYRQGLGDCFLITIPRKNGKPFYAVIDCGVILGTQDAGTIMTEVVEHIIQTTGGRVDLVAATHEHWDHISGFGQAREIWTDKNRLTIGQVWLSWAENKNDPLARKLKAQHQALKIALQGAASRMRLAGDAATAQDVSNLLDFFGAAGSTSDALDTVKDLAEVRYCKPQDDPVQLEGTDVKVYVLGPPPDEKMIKKYNPSKREPETYGMDSMNTYLDAVQPTMSDDDVATPFDERFQIPLNMAQQMPFFQQRYWGEDAESRELSQAWRRIDGSWLDSSSSLALQLDSATNNTCLVLAFELGDGDVLLFAADAQVGNWLSWQDLKWEVDGQDVTGPDLLRRAIFYKVGHHGSHNATLRELGLEEMKSLKLAFVPVDHAMALKKRWNQMPLNELMKRLNEITDEKVVRIDQDIPAKLSKSMVPDKLFHEIAL
jgi:glyoxylase-like metal-dependent hydrolase (beta-lactamase superfamily II)